MTARSYIRVVAVLAVMLAGFAAVPAGAADIGDIRLGRDGKGTTRIVLDLSEMAPWRVTVRKSGSGRKMVAVELAASRFAIEGKPGQSGTADGLGAIGSYAWQAGHADRAQLLFELSETSVPSAAFIIKPKGGMRHTRLVIDLVAASDTEFTAAMARPKGPLAAVNKASAEDLADGREAPFGGGETRKMVDMAEAIAADLETSVPAQPLRLASAVPVPRVKPARHTALRPLVVIDPGHGGKDPGAIGVADTHESNVTLAAAKKLKEILLKRGYRVKMTREKDIYIELEERLMMARRENADLFLSIHADANARADLRGASVYTLSDRGESRIISKARNKGDFQLAGFDMSTVDRSIHQMVFDMETSGNRRASSVFANTLIESLQGTVTMVNNTHREGNLMVLLAPDVPAVLLELAFMSNAEDEKNLNSRAWRRKTMTSVADGIDTYFEEARDGRRHAARLQGDRVVTE